MAKVSADHDRVDDGAADREVVAEERIRVADGVVVARGYEGQRNLQGDEDEPRRQGPHLPRWLTGNYRTLG